MKLQVETRVLLMKRAIKDRADNLLPDHLKDKTIPTLVIVIKMINFMINCIKHDFPNAQLNGGLCSHMKSKRKL